MSNISVLYICDQKACPSKYCDPCFNTFKPEHAKNPESIKIAQDFLDHFDIEIRTETYDEDDQTVIKYHYIFKEK